MSAPEPLRLWCNYDFAPAEAEALRAGAAGHRLTLAPSSNDGAGDPDAAAAHVLLGQPDPALLLASPRVRWAEITSAGYAPYDRADLRAAFQARGAVLTNSSQVFAEACAQHLAAMLLSLARELPRCLDNQRGPRVWLHEEPRAGRRHLVNGQTVFIYGFGAIARRLAELLAPLRMNLFGVRRKPKGDESIPMLTEADADARLAEADHVLNILPQNDGTHHFFDAARFACFRHGAKFYNIGRGATVNQDALLATLQSSHLAAAYLDVTDPEPLPPEHPLWSAPNCFITPHLAGTHSDEAARLVRHILDNLRAFESGHLMQNRVI